MAVVPMELEASGQPDKFTGILQNAHALTIVDRKQYQDPIRVDEGVVWFDEYTISDGTRYRQLTGVPQNQNTEVSADIGTPWMTCEEGHNLRTLLRFMSVGIPGRIIGPPRIWVEGTNPLDSLHKTIEAAKQVELAKDAYNFLSILKAHDEEGVFKYNFEPNQSFYYGESRGAMIGFGVKAFSQLFGRIIHEAELVDPCLAQKTSAGDLLVPANAQKALREVRSFGGLVLSVLGEQRRKYYKRTLDPSFEYIIPAATTWGALASGQAGEMASLMELDEAVALTFYNGSVANQELFYRQILKDHFNVRYLEGDGGHLGLASRSSLFAPIGRIVVGQQQLQTEGRLDLPKLWLAEQIAA